MSVFMVFHVAERPDFDLQNFADNYLRSWEARDQLTKADALTSTKSQPSETSEPSIYVLFNVHFDVLKIVMVAWCMNLSTFESS